MIRTVIVTCLAAACVGNLSPDGLKKQLIGERPRIVGGSDANIEDYKYQLSLEFEKYHLCGASIIKESWALSAGHCFQYSEDVDQYKLRAGSSVIETEGMLHNVAKILSHPEYTSFPSTDFDFALIKVAEPFIPSIGVPIPLPMQGQDTAPGLEATVSGWGVNSSSSFFATLHLQVVTLPVISQAECKNVFGPAVTDQVICTGVATVGGGIGACFGDSGGPMVVGGELIGVVSFGSWYCGEDGAPAAYAKVSTVRDWIDEISIDNATDCHTTTEDPGKSSAGRSDVVYMAVALPALFVLHFTK